MVPMLDQAALSEHVDVVSQPDGCETVRYEHDGPPGEKVTYSPEECRFGTRV